MCEVTFILYPTISHVSSFLHSVNVEWCVWLAAKLPKSWILLTIARNVKMKRTTNKGYLWSLIKDFTDNLKCTVKDYNYSGSTFLFSVLELFIFALLFLFCLLACLLGFIQKNKIHNYPNRDWKKIKQRRNRKIKRVKNFKLIWQYCCSKKTRFESFAIIQQTLNKPVNK